MRGTATSFAHPRITLKPDIHPRQVLFIHLFFKHTVMVTVKNYHLRTVEEGKTFISLELTGEIELVQSANTGRFYATARRCFISSTFDEATAQQMVGKQLPGNIVKVPCEQYQYIVPETKEEITLAHRFDYVPEESTSTISKREMETA